MLQSLLALAICLLAFHQVAADSLECQALADTYLQKHNKEPSPYNGSNLVYFLHIPRTAGRTLHSCFLKVGTPQNKRCPKGYDHLRINVSVPNCYLLSSHDDFSVVSMLPNEVSVLTQVRDPVDRVLSAYEFAIEVGSRFMNRPATFRKRPNKIATEDVWPWSYLVPYFAADIKARVAKARSVPQPETGNWVFVRHPDGDEYYYNKVKGISKWNLTVEEAALLLPPINPYDNELVMPLAEFLKQPIAQELLFNGEAFQVLGITNYSHWGDSGSMRSCIWSQPSMHSSMLDLALKRLDKFIHVGTTDKLADSVAAAAVAMQFTMDGPAYGASQDPDEGVPGARSTTGTIYTAADLPMLARKVREARLALQSLQKSLFQAHQSGTPSEQLQSVKDKVNTARAALRDRMDDLAAARSLLPTGQHDSSLEEEAGHEVEAPPPAKPVTLVNPLGVEYQRCAQRAQTRNNQRRDQSLSSVSMPDGRYISFSREARKKIPAEVIELIKERNSMDVALHKRALELLASRREQYKAAGKLGELPYVPPMRMGPRNKAEAFRIPKPELRRDSDEL